MAGRTPRSVIITVVLAVLVAAGALGGAGVIRWRATHANAAAPTSQKPPPSSSVGVSGCLVEPCSVPVTTTVGGTTIELVADARGQSGRLRIGGVTSGTIIEATITDRGVTLTKDSLQCVPGGPVACLIKGGHEGGLAGQVVVGRSDKWSMTENIYLSSAGYLVLANIDADASPEILAAQHTECGRATDTCPVFMQVFGINGKVTGCTKEYPRLDKLPGYGSVKIAETMLGPCP